MVLERNFYAVGQGLFCSEMVKDNKGDILFCMVYDCGSETGNNCLFREIDILKKELNGSNVDILFLSHLHNDHINGVEQLCSQVAVKRIVLPQVTPMQRISALLYASTSEYKDTQKLREILNGEEYNDSTIIHIPILRYRKGEELDRKDIDAYFNKIKKLELNYKKDKDKIVIEYLPFYYEGEPGDIFETELRAKFPELLSAAENGDLPKFNEIYNLQEKNIRNLYKKHFGKNLNESSMPVLSIPSMSLDDKKRCCLYTGDYSKKIDPKDNMLRSLYKDHWKEIHIFQSPHHGSKYDNPKDLYKDLSYNTRCILSYGSDYRYKHPHKETILNIRIERCIDAHLSDMLPAIKLRTQSNKTTEFLKIKN